MRTRTRHLFAQSRGAALVEYVILLLLIGGAGMTLTMTEMGRDVRQVFCIAASEVSKAGGGSGYGCAGVTVADGIRE